MMLKVVLACVVLMAGTYAQDGRVEPAPDPGEPVPWYWSQLQCCLGGLRLYAWKGIYQLRNIYPHTPSTPRPCCHQITLTWRIMAWPDEWPGQCGGNCPCTVNETLCCGSCRERYPGEVHPDARRHWKEHQCCRDWNGETYAKHVCFGTGYTFLQEDNCRSACPTTCSWWWPLANAADDAVCHASGGK